jgi:hypothetical protein
MDWLYRAVQAIENTAIGDAMRENDTLFPLVESIHVLAICLFVGSIAVVDMRLLGIASARRPAGELMRAVLPVTWVSFVVAVAAGSLLFVTHATTYLNNGYFDAKMALIAAAGVNMLGFHFVGGRDIDPWGIVVAPPVSARVAGCLSLILWIGVVACGRWIGFTMPAE